MSNDPEMDSLAGSALARAAKHYSPEHGLLPKKFVAYCVRREVWDYFRTIKKHGITMPSEFWAKYTDETFVDNELPIPREDWELLVDRYINRIPINVLAHRQNISPNRLQAKLNAAKSRFIKAME